MAWHHCHGPEGNCGCQHSAGTTPVTYETKVVEPGRPEFRPSAPEDRLDRFTVKQLAEIMGERGVTGKGYQIHKDEKVSRLAEDLRDDPEALDEYEDRYGIR